MATLFNSLYDRFTNDATVSAIVGDRVWENEAMQDVFPLITISYEEQEDTSLTIAPAPTYDVVITCEALDASVRDALGKAVKAAINRQSWQDADVNVGVALLQNERRDSQNLSGNVETLIYSNEQNYMIIAAF